MPFSISSDESGGFWVSNQNTGRRMNKKPLTKKRALRYQRALYANSGDTKMIKHDQPFTAEQKDSLQNIHDHAADLGADCGGTDGEMAKHLKHGATSAEKQDKIQAMHNHAGKLGAECMVEGTGSAAPFGKNFKSFKDYVNSSMPVMAGEDIDNPPDDIRNAAYAIASLTTLLESEDEEPEDRKTIADTIRSLLKFIESELQEAEAGEDSDDMKSSSLAGGKVSAIKIAARADVKPKEGTNKYGDVTFADEKNKRYPIDTEEHIRAAWNYINKSDNASKYSAEDVSKIKGHIVSAWKEKIDKAGPPSAEKKDFDLSYAKSLGIEIPDLAVKFMGRDVIKSYTFLWGNPDKVDVEREYFTPKTDFWDSNKSTRWLTWDHGQDKDFKADTRIGEIVDYGDDDTGRWYEAKLDRSHKYRKMIDQLIEDGVLGTSSDSAPQYVIREKTGKATWLKQWPWFASALTDVPCEPRMIGSIEVLKAWGITLPEAPDTARQIELLQLRSKRERIRSTIGGK